MNKIFNINLGGYPFTIDDDAYKKLDSYLTTIKHHFSTSEGCEDIISDIEVRIAELFNEHLKGQPIVGMREVDKVISIMGTPEEFGATSEETKKEKTKTKTSHSDSRTHGQRAKTRRLFRDPDEKVIGGVCSGIAAYFGIADPVWVRLLFVVLAVPSFGLFLYPILWIAIPMARTSADKLSMKGEKVDVSNIARKVEEEMNNLADTINEMTRDFKSKKKV